MKKYAHKDRMEGLDAAKGLAIVSVIIIHTEPFVATFPPMSKLYFIGQVLQQMCSWAVPFFFTASGFLFSRRATQSSVISVWSRYVSRLFVVLTAWTIIDGALWGPWLKSVLDAKSLAPLFWNILAIPSFAAKRPDLFLFRGTSVSLWYLVSLIFAISLLAAAIRESVGRHKVVFIGVMSYLVALGMGSYSSLIGPDKFFLLEQRGPFLAVGFVALGHYLAQSGTVTEYRRLKYPLLAWAALFIEALVHATARSTSFQEQPYLLTTFPLAATLLLYFAVNPARLFSSFGLCTLGRYSLGIYLIHIPILNALLPYKQNSVLVEMLFPLLLLLLSFGLSVLLKHVPGVRRIVV